MGIVYEVGDFEADQIDYDVPLDTFSDHEIGSSLIELFAAVKSINRQLVDHRTGVDLRDGAWAHRASRAKQYKLQVIDKLRMESQRRGMPEVLPEYAAQIAAQQEFQARKAAEAARIQAECEARVLPHKLLMEQQREAAAQRRAEREEKHRITMTADAQKFQGKAGSFLAAAKVMLTKEQRQAIWAKAESMFPDQFPKSDGREGSN